MIKIKTFLMALFIVPLLCGSALCASALDESDLTEILDRKDALSRLSKVESEATEFSSLKKMVEANETLDKDEIHDITGMYYKACKKNPGTCGEDVDAILNDMKDEDFNDYDLDSVVKTYGDDGATIEDDTTDKKVVDENTTEGDEGDGKGADIAKKAIEAVSSAAMGIGAMQMAQGLSEQKADKEAEADMRQYLNTFTCTYGAKAQTVKFGPEDVTLDAGADLVKYATEYRGLAERLKKTKKALNLTPGIEEEEIIDPATSGLYSYTPAEKKDGQYTSLSKAILDEESEDAKEWAAQKSKSKKRVIGGAVALGAGTLGTVFGDKIVDKVSEKIAENRETRDLLKSVGGKEGLSSLLKDTDGSEEGIMDALKEKYGDKLTAEQMGIIAGKAGALFRKEKGTTDNDTDDE